jgi:hypothetical protein
MEEWFHDSNNKIEVINAQPQIAKELRSLQHFFPRNTNTNGHNLPKMHGISKGKNWKIHTHPSVLILCVTSFPV